jgi:hypothetical protein
MLVVMLPWTSATGATARGLVVDGRYFLGVLERCGRCGYKALGLWPGLPGTYPGLRSDGGASDVTTA